MGYYLLTFDQDFERHERGEVVAHEYFDSLRSSLGIDISDDQFIDGWNNIYIGEVAGIAALLLTVLTDHHLGIIRVLPYSLHLAVDGLVGIVFVVAPLAFNFAGIEFWYYMILGLTVLAVVGLHQPEDSVAAA